MIGLNFYRCAVCGKILWIIHRESAPTICCGREMQRILPNTEDADGEKHVPVITVGDGRITVSVGSAPHPMAEAHHIQWIVLKTDRTVYFRKLGPSCEPKTEFFVGDEKPEAVYAFCNLHGLWMAEA